jgi:NADH-quinone oxidoreductase subunit F
MDLDLMASVCERIIGNCLCVLGDAMAMPIGSMVEKFRGEFEQIIEEKRALAGLGPMPEPSALEVQTASPAGAYH